MRQLVPASMLIVVSACSSSHAIAPDGALPEEDAGACTGMAPQCVQVSGHECGDVLLAASCVEDAWACPRGWTRESSAECWCYGGRPGCDCTPTGWACPVDAGVAEGCPSDFLAAEGTPCAEEGRSCGACTDPCGFCNLLQCSGGTWTRLEAPPPPPPCVSFDCGPELRCDAVTQYCERVNSDIGGEAPSFRCEAYPASCASCECLPGNACEGDAETGITVTYFGG